MTVVLAKFAKQTQVHAVVLPPDASKIAIVEAIRFAILKASVVFVLLQRFVVRIQIVNKVKYAILKPKCAEPIARAVKKMQIAPMAKNEIQTADSAVLLAAAIANARAINLAKIAYANVKPLNVQAIEIAEEKVAVLAIRQQNSVSLVPSFFVQKIANVLPLGFVI